MAMTVNLSGFKELDAELAKLSKAAGRNALRRAGMTAMQPMAAAARRLAPVDEGDLQESISVGFAIRNDIGRAEFAAVKRAGGSDEEAVMALRDARRAASATAPSAVIYMGPEAAPDRNTAIKAVAQEYGTSFHPPQPYMRPAFDAQAQPTLERLKRELWFEVSKSVERAARKAARG